MIKAVILVGGLGTRLRPLTLNTPKAMVPVLNAPFLEHVLIRLRDYDIRNVVLALSHMAPAVSDYFGKGENLGIELEYAVEPIPLGTAGAVRNAAGHIDDTCVVMNGDIYTDLDLGTMMAFHRRCRSKVTIALTEVDNPSAYGLVETRENWRIHRFLEKPSPEQITTNRINSGTYIIEPEVLESIPSGHVYSFEKELFPQLLAADQPVFAFADHSYWIDIGTPRKYHQLNRDLLRGKAKQYGFNEGDEIVIGPRSTVHPTATLRGPALIGPDCIIGPGVTITGPAVIGPGCVIEEGVSIIDTVIWWDVVAAPDCDLESCVIGNGCRLGPGCELHNSIVGDHLALAPGLLDSGNQFWPGSLGAISL